MSRTVPWCLMTILSMGLLAGPAPAADVMPTGRVGGPLEQQDVAALIKDVEARFSEVDLDGLRLGQTPDTLQSARMQVDLVEQALIESVGKQVELQTRLDAVAESRTRALAAADRQIARLEAEVAALKQKQAAGPALAVDPTAGVFPFKTSTGTRLTQVLFDPGSAAVTPGGLRRAKEAADWIKANGARKVRVIGFSDTAGSSRGSAAMARARADSIAALLVESGVARGRIERIGHGEKVLPEATADRISEPLNRRVEIFVVDEG